MLDAAPEEIRPQELEEWRATFRATAGTDQLAYKAPERIVRKFG
jgi:hypothetical protein